MEDYDYDYVYDIQNVKTVSTVSQHRGGCCIHQTVMTTQQLEQTDQKFRDLVAAALRQIDDSDYGLVAEQVTAMEAVVAQVKQIIDAATSRDKNRVEKLEKELAEVKRELERHRQDRWPWATTLGRTAIGFAGGVLLSDSLRSNLRRVRDLLNLILDE